MFKTYLTYFVIPIGNDIALLDKTIESILNQTYSRKELRILFMDNCSTDGSYEKILTYIQEYPQLISVCRMEKPTTPARLLKSAWEYLRFSMLHFVVYLNPGDVVYPSFIEKAIHLMHMNKELACIVANVDVQYENVEVNAQAPIFTDNCIIDKEANYELFFTAGIGAKVIAIHRGVRNVCERLVDVEKRTDFHDWISYAYPKEGIIAYLGESMGKVLLKNSEDPIFDLMTKAYSLKGLFYNTETVMSDNKRKQIEKSDMNAAYYAIAMNGLYEAKRAKKRGQNLLAEKCILFSEIMWPQIVEDDEYKNTVNEHISVEKTEENCYVPMIVSIKPPKNCFIF